MKSLHRFGARAVVAAFMAALAIVIGGAYTQPSNVFNLADFGAVGDGSTINNTQLQAAFTAAASGGKIVIPCGVYKVTATPTLPIAAGAHVELAGDGADCAVIFMSGAVNGPTFTFVSQWSSLSVSGLTVETDQVGGTNCMVWTGSFTNANSANAATNNVAHVTFRGNDTYSSDTKYCGTGLSETSISNINLIDFAYQGIAARAGTALSLAGSGTGSTYSVQINISHSTFNNCNVAISYGDWVQGLQGAILNATGCNQGIATVSSPSGQPSGLIITSSQFNTFSCGICVNAPTFANAQLTNNQMIFNANSTGIKIQGTNFIVSSNELNATSLTTTIGVLIGSTYGNGGVVSLNEFAAMADGIQVLAASQATTKLDANFFQSNSADYSINSAARSVEVNDMQPRAYAVIAAQIPCDARDKYSTVQVADAPAATYNVTVSAGGGANYLGMKCDSTRWYAD